MAATISNRTKAKVLPFSAPCQSVNQTDRNRRLPTLSCADIDSFFEHASDVDTPLAKVA